MRRWSRGLAIAGAAGLGLAGSAISGCNTVYTESEVSEQETKLDEAADSEEEYSRSVEEEGGASDAILERDVDDAVTESDR